MNNDSNEREATFDDSKPTTQVSGEKLDDTFPSGGVGKVSENDPVLPKPQAVKVPGSISKPRK